MPLLLSGLFCFHPLSHIFLPYRKESVMPHSSKPRLYPAQPCHVILKSLDSQCLFREEADRIQFLCFLREIINDRLLTVYAYGLMENHIHLLFEAPQDPAQALYHLKKRYSLYYKRKYKTGKALFQTLFKAEKVSDPVSLVCFILKDPVRQGHVSDPFSSSWTSIGIFRGQDLPVDKEALLSLSGDSSWERLLSLPQPCSFMEYINYPSPREARLIVRSLCSPEEIENFHDLPPERKKQILTILRNCGVTYGSIREIFRISKYEIDMALGKIRDIPNIKR